MTHHEESAFVENLTDLISEILWKKNIMVIFQTNHLVFTLKVDNRIPNKNTITK
jgi:hypothetical protein